MQHVYSRAICCIAATAAKDGDIGLFFDRDPQCLLPIRVNMRRARMCGRNTGEALLTYSISSPVVTSRMAIDIAPLNQRAWVAQERYLSTRTIHFTQELLFWECLESVTSEQDPEGRLVKTGVPFLYEEHESAIHILKSNIGDYKSRLVIPSEGRARVSLREFHSWIYKHWCRFRFEYSGLSLTKEEDILVALNGIARSVAEVTKDALVAGLWRDRLIEDLCWRRYRDNRRYPIDVPPRPSIWRAPTWSWASINGTVMDHLGSREGDSASDSIKEMAVVKDLTVDQMPSGQVINASLTLTCRMITPYWERFTVISDMYGSLDGRHLEREYRLVILRHCKFRSEGKGSVQGILIEPSRHKPGSYERLAYFELVEEEELNLYHGSDEVSGPQRMLDIYHKTQERTIQLI